MQMKIEGKSSSCTNGTRKTMSNGTPVKDQTSESWAIEGKEMQAKGIETYSIK
jgi:hypothetical protein